MVLSREWICFVETKAPSPLLFSSSSGCLRGVISLNWHKYSTTWLQSFLIGAICTNSQSRLSELVVFLEFCWWFQQNEYILIPDVFICARDEKGNTLSIATHSFFLKSISLEWLLLFYPALNSFIHSEQLFTFHLFLMDASSLWAGDYFELVAPRPFNFLLLFESKMSFFQS